MFGSGIIKIDVTIATKNNEETIQQCIKNIKKYIPYNRIILIDDSEDNTAKIAEKLGAEVIHFSGLLGQTRLKQAQVSDTEWIASIDSDVFVYPNWWEVMSKFTTDDVGIIRSFMEGSIKKLVPSYDAFTKWSTERRFLRDRITTTMGNNLLRRSLLVNCGPKLARVHAGEDTIIGKHVVDSGYKCVVSTKITALHYQRDPISHMKMAYRREGESRVMFSGRLMGIITVLGSFLFTLRSLIEYSYAMKTVDSKLFRFLMSCFADTWKGAIGKIKGM
jgi:glycosyltransferase involved in cell wall biosynthesis